MATESAFGVLPPGGTIYLDHWRETDWGAKGIPESAQEIYERIPDLEQLARKIRDSVQTGNQASLDHAYDLFRARILIQNEIQRRSKEREPAMEVRSTYRLPIKISRSRRLIGWAMLTATAGAWAAHLLW